VGIAAEASAHCGFSPCQRRALTVEGLPSVVSLAAGGMTTCAVGVDASLWCWGEGIGSHLNTGSPVRVAGPWEDAGASCILVEQAIGRSLVAANSVIDADCRTDRDCTEVALDVSCYHACSSGPVSTSRAARIRAALSTAETSTCPGAQRLGCDVDVPSCATPRGQLACNGGLCVRFDPEASGCSNVCECRALKEASPGAAILNDCAEADLYVASAIPCTGCGSSKLYVVLGNHGHGNFDGDVLIESLPEAIAGQPPVAVPPPLSRALSIPSGGISEAIAFDYQSPSGLVRLKLTAPGNCNTESDGRLAATPDFAVCSN
jgi:hypothetical protein